VLDPGSVDLRRLADALEDRDGTTRWFLHLRTGELVARAQDAAPDDDLREVRAVSAREGYRDMADFVASIQHRRASDLLERAITGRGAFRRFKDTLVEFPDLREQWFRFRDARAARRALRWLADEGLVDTAAAAALAAQHADPGGAPPDLPTAVAADLGLLYGDRLQRVRVVTDTDDVLALALVLADLRDPWDELRVLDEVLWRHTERSGRLVTALPVTAADLVAPTTAVLRRAAAGGAAR
jgi:hypothetical protein